METEALRELSYAGVTLPLLSADERREAPPNEPAQSLDIIIVDSSRLMRGSLKAILHSCLGSGLFSPNIIGEGGSVSEAVCSAGWRARPDLILYGLNFEGSIEGGLAGFCEARANFPSAKSIIVTDGVLRLRISEALHLGVHGILSRDVSAHVFQRAIEFVVLGQMLFPSELRRPLADVSTQVSALASIPLRLDDNSVIAVDQQTDTALSKREQQVLQCLVNGLSNKVIARRLEIAEATVKVHVKSLLRKLQVTNRTQAAIKGFNRLVERPS